MEMPSFEDWLEAETGFAHYIDEEAISQSPDRIPQNTNVEEEIPSELYAPILFELMKKKNARFPIVYQGKKLLISVGNQMIVLAIISGITYSENPHVNAYFGALLDIKHKIGHDFDTLATYFLFQQHLKAAKLLIDLGFDKPFCCQGRESECDLTQAYLKLRTPLVIPDKNAPKDPGISFSKN